MEKTKDRSVPDGSDKNESKSAALLILIFSLPILQHYHIHQNAPLSSTSPDMKWSQWGSRGGWRRSRGRAPQGSSQKPNLGYISKLK